jgi:hypothetical protein
MQSQQDQKPNHEETQQHCVEHLDEISQDRKYDDLTSVKHNSGYFFQAEGPKAEEECSINKVGCSSAGLSSNSVNVGRTPPASRNHYQPDSCRPRPTAATAASTAPSLSESADSALTA